MIAIPGARRASRPVCATRPLAAASARWSTRPVCATRRLAAVAPVVALRPPAVDAHHQQSPGDAQRPPLARAA